MYKVVCHCNSGWKMTFLQGTMTASNLCEIKHILQNSASTMDNLLSLVIKCQAHYTLPSQDVFLLSLPSQIQGPSHCIWVTSHFVSPANSSKGTTLHAQNVGSTAYICCHHARPRRPGPSQSVNPPIQPEAEANRELMTSTLYTVTEAPQEMSHTPERHGKAINREQEEWDRSRKYPTIQWNTKWKKVGSCQHFKQSLFFRAPSASWSSYFRVR